MNIFTNLNIINKINTKLSIELTLRNSVIFKNLINPGFII